MTSFDRADRRAANAAAWAAVAARFRALPKSQRDRLIADFGQQKARGGTMQWMGYLEAVLPLVESGEARLPS